jgi:hypothetical protein
VRNNLFSSVAKHFKPALLVLFVALVAAQTSVAGGVGAPQTAPARKAELETAAAAKRALAELGSNDFARVKDARMRAAGLRAVAALKAIANNKSATREAALVTQFDRAIRNLKQLPQPAGLSLQMCDKDHETCKEMCKTTGLCNQCDWGINLCYLVRLGIEMAQEKDPSKN